MKVLTMICITFFVSSWSLSAEKTKRGTRFEFSEADIKGRYNSSGEGLSIVEDDKSIIDLLALRKNFKDRVHKNLREQK